jgi:hypothetical protein
MAYPIEDIGTISGSLSNSRTVVSIFDDVRSLMNDENGNTFSDTVLLVHFNRLYRMFNKYLAELGASVGRADGQITTSVGQREYELPGDFMHFCREPGGRAWFHRSDADVGLELQDQKFVSKVSTDNGQPSWLYIRPDSAGQAPWIMGFDVPPDAVYTYYFKYYPTVPQVTNTAGYMPWKSLLDDTFIAELEFWARNWKEFNADLQLQQAGSARLQIQTVLGELVLETKNVGPEMWRHGGNIDRVI